MTLRRPVILEIMCFEPKRAATSTLQHAPPTGIIHSNKQGDQKRPTVSFTGINVRSPGAAVIILKLLVQSLGRSTRKEKTGPYIV